MDNLSIHPRNWPENRRNEETNRKSNTAKPHKGKGKLGKKMAALNQRRLAHSATLKTPGVQPIAYKAPGSMNQHKCRNPRGRKH